MSEQVAAPVEGQAAPEPAQATAWTDTLPDEAKEYVTAKGFKDPGAVIESYRNLEKLRGVPAERLLTLPGDATAEGAMDPVWDKLGRPEAPDKYTNALGEGFDAGVFSKVAETAHKLGLNDNQFQGLQTIMAEQAATLQEAQDKQAAEAFDKWKAGNTEGFETAARVMSTVGVDEAGLESLLSGDKTALYDFLSKVGARSAEGKVVHGEQPKDSTFGMSPERAKAKIAEKMEDAAFMKRYTSSNAQTRQSAIAEMESLHKAAAGG